MKILVVDDDDTIRELVADIITEMGWEAETCANGKEALELLSKGSYPLMFLDLIMPEMGGVETLRRIQKEGYKVKIVVLSGNVSKDLHDQCRKYGVRKFLEKPVEVSDIDFVLRGEKNSSLR